MAKGKAFVCFCMDVTEEAIEQSFREGFSDPEMVKRFTGAMMGCCQGKICAMNFLSCVAKLGGVAPESLRPPTCRPPLVPVPVAVLAATDDDHDDGAH